MAHHGAKVFSLALALFAGSGLPVAALGQDAQPPAQKVRKPRPKPQPNQPIPSQPDDDDSAPAAPADGSTPATPATPSTTPAQPAMQPPSPAGTIPSITVVTSPYLVRESPKDWTLTVNVTVRPDRSDPRNAGLKQKLPDMREFRFDTLSMVFPLPAESGSAVPDISTLRGKLLINDKPAADAKGRPIFPVLLDKQISGELYHSGTRLMRFGLDQPTTCREIGMEFEIQYRCYDTQLDENAAMQVDWPKGEVPALTRATLAPQMFIDYERTRGDGGPVTTEFDKKMIADLVTTYTGGNPRGARPLAAAKYIAGRIAADFQTSGLGLQFLNTGELQGFNLQGVPQTIQLRKGSEFDINAVTVAALRGAGLPARLMIGYDLGEDDRQPSDFLTSGNRKNARLRSWTEFGLYDEARRTLTWIPVDVVRMRKNSSRMGAMEKPWKYFGTHDELNRVVPVAFGFHPPTTVESYGAPGLWGWLMTPMPPETAYQAIKFRAGSSAKTADTAKDAKKKKDQKKDGY